MPAISRRAVLQWATIVLSAAGTLARRGWHHADSLLSQCSYPPIENPGPLGYAMFAKGQLVAGFWYSKSSQMAEAEHWAWIAELPSGEFSEPQVALRDGHKHTLAVTFPFPYLPSIEGNVSLQARAGKQVKLNYPSVPVCEASHGRAYRLAMCANVGVHDNFNVPTHPRAVSNWLDYHMRQGVQHVSLYFDVPASYDLRPWVDLVGNRTAGAAVVVRWNFKDKKNYHVAHDRYGFKGSPPPSQMLMENHCLQFYKRSARWLLKCDIDEYVQVTPSNVTLLDRLRYHFRKEARRASALQIRPRFCSMHPPVKEEVRDMASYTSCDPIYRDAGFGRTKLIMSTLATDYLSVHVVTTSRYKMYIPRDIVLNHFKGYGRFQLSNPTAAPDWKESWETVMNRTLSPNESVVYPVGRAYLNASR